MYSQKRLLISFLASLFFQYCTGIDTITPNRPIKDGDVLVSIGEAFVLGFFSPGVSTNRYVGIWYNKVQQQTVVWVANRDRPITNTSGVLSIDSTGNLAIHYQNESILIWLTNVSTIAATNNASAKLLDSGNLVLYQGDSKSGVVAWQSFDYPTNTLLPLMKFGKDRRTGFNRFLTSWMSGDDPGTGNYSCKFDLAGSPQLFLYKGTVPVWRSGPWNGLRWSGVPEMTSHFIFNLSYVDNHDEVSMSYGMINASIFSRLVINESGFIERHTWQEGNRRWVQLLSIPRDKCDNYGECGAYSNCDLSNPEEFGCRCFPGYEPRSARDWYLRDGSAGCVTKPGSQLCRSGEGFVKLAGVKVPDTSMARVDMRLDLKECQEMCLRNCSCTGFTSADIAKGSGCITWYGNLMDTRQFSNDQDLYVRVDSVVLAQYSKKSKGHGKAMVRNVVLSVAAMLLILSLASFWLVMKRRKGARRQRNLLFSSITSSASLDSPGNNISESGTDFPCFDLSTIIAATDNFSFANKLGEGGFGTVYKGRLYNGQEIAIKRLSNKSGQGVEEFKNEVSLLAKLQHRNLVRLLGCCIQNQEKMIIYEYLPNKGLDSFIFDKAKGPLVDWRKCFEIVMGIVRGMTYLHQDSRLRIIHRDLKASNVLLDSALNPKISDFGMARIFGGDQIEANTKRVVGTYGYMSPEYAMEGLFSIKSDVFSFGVLLLEIISGRKNNSYYQENSLNLIGHVWDLWRKDNALCIVDSSLGESYEAHEVLRCIHIGLLCVQEYATDRPTMSRVAFMLCNEGVLPPPKQPAFIFRKNRNGPDTSSASAGTSSVNDLTITMVEAR